MREPITLTVLGCWPSSLELEEPSAFDVRKEYLRIILNNDLRSIDASLAAATLGATPERLLND